MAFQTAAGKAFEYTLLIEVKNYLSIKQGVEILEDQYFYVAEACFNKFNEKEKLRYRAAAKCSVPILCNLEPRLEHPLGKDDILQLAIVSDKSGIQGDVRDILAIRSKYNWEIGISAKNHHAAVKHSRLSAANDFGKKWLNIECSKKYFDSIQPIFEELGELTRRKKFWRDLIDKESKYYYPVLEAFRNELLQLNRNNPDIVAQRLVHYLIGKMDFYKVIKGKRKTIIQGFNVNGTLNLPANEIKPAQKVSRIKFPGRIIELAFKRNSSNTLILTADEGWQISFRIHNASSKVEPSLKFDINLIGHPQNLYTHHTSWNY